MRIVGIHLEPGGVGWLRCWNWTTALKERGHDVKHRPHAPTQFEWTELDDYLQGADVVITCRMANCIDPKTYVGVLSREKEARHRDDVRIYWGGGGGHYDDLLLVKDALLRIFSERPNVKLVFSNILPDWAVDLPANRCFFIRFA